MYVAIDDTALRIIRSLRCQWATFALPHRETPTRSLVLKPGDPDPAHSGNYEYRVSEDDSFELLGQTLRDCDEQTPRDDLDVLRLNEIVANTHFTRVYELGDSFGPVHRHLQRATMALPSKAA